MRVMLDTNILISAAAYPSSSTERFKDYDNGGIYGCVFLISLGHDHHGLRRDARDADQYEAVKHQRKHHEKALALAGAFSLSMQEFNDIMRSVCSRMT